MGACGKTIVLVLALRDFANVLVIEFSKNFLGMFSLSEIILDISAKSFNS